MFNKQETEKVRIIKNYSTKNPEKEAPNNYTAPFKTTFMSVLTAIPFLSLNCFMAKTDLDSAFRLLSIHPLHTVYI